MRGGFAAAHAVIPHEGEALVADVFISYAREERERAKLFKEKLDTLGLTTFFDIQGDIEAGDAYTVRITEGIRGAKIVLGCWSPMAMTRDWVRRECMMARDQKKLVPICVAPMSPSDLPAEFYDVSFEDVSDYEGQEKHFGWSQTLSAIARRLEAWAEAHPEDAEASRALDVANAVRKAGLAAYAQPQATGAVTVNPTAGAAIWSNVQHSLDPRELRQFADSFPNTMESYQARQRAEHIENAGKALAGLRAFADRAVRDAQQMANAPKADKQQRDMAYRRAAEEVHYESERVRHQFGDILPPGEPERTTKPILHHLEGKHAEGQKAQNTNRGCHMVVLAIIALIAVLAVGNMFLGG